MSRGFCKGGLSSTTVRTKPMAFSEIVFVNYLLGSAVMFSLCEPSTIPSCIILTYTFLHEDIQIVILTLLI